MNKMIKIIIIILLILVSGCVQETKEESKQLSESLISFVSFDGMDFEPTCVIENKLLSKQNETFN